MVDIAKGIAATVTLGTFAGGLQIIDETTEPLEAALEIRPERTDREFRVRPGQLRTSPGPNLLQRGA